MIADRQGGKGAVQTEDSGWKLVHGDVFRFPNNRELFCAILGIQTLNPEP